MNKTTKKILLEKSTAQQKHNETFIKTAFL